MRARFPGATLDRGAGMKDWLDRIFGGPATSDAHRLVELDEFCGPDATTLERLAEVFENAATLLKPHADGSVSQAFWDLNSNVFFALSDESIIGRLAQGPARISDAAQPFAMSLTGVCKRQGSGTSRTRATDA